MEYTLASRVARLLPALIFATNLTWAGSAGLEEARKLYHLTHFERSLHVLQAIPQKDAAVYELMGLNYYGQGEFKKATEVLEKALALDPNSSEIHLWLGRAFGRRAETSSPFTAPGLASHARQSFEQAARLNPNNLEAQSDLFEYYLEAPGFLGGGLDKASATAERISRINAAEGAWAQAKLAEKRKEFHSAEAHLLRAIEMAPQQIGRLIDLAKLQSKQGRIKDADESIAKAERIAPNNPKLVYAKAELYIKTKRNLDVARELLKRYLSSPITPD